MADVKISALPTKTVASTDLVPVSDSGATTTSRVTAGAIAALGGGAPAAHKNSHATGGSDALTASDIGAANASHVHSASDVTSGVFATARLGTGSASSSTYLRGDGTWSSVSASDSRFDLFLPPAPGGLTATALNNAALLSWGPPTVCAQTPITDYGISVSDDGGSSWSDFSHSPLGPASSVTVTGLSNGTQYFFKVRAVNAIGAGPDSSTAFTTPAPVAPFSALVVGGGGGSGDQGGGGGAGGVVALNDQTWPLATPFWIVVGAGGAGGGDANGAQGTDGSQSMFAASTADGGGGGGGYDPYGSNQNGRNGASGGGAGTGFYVAGSGGTGEAGQGHDGGASSGTPGSELGGGGGGAGVAGGNADAGTEHAGSGGDGVSSSITGSSVFYGGGGGGFANNGHTPGAGGAGGGGAGVGSGSGTPGADNTGGGGGGCPSAYGSFGGNGGSGVVILRLPSSVGVSIGGGLTYSSATVGGDTVYTFTAGSDQVEFS